MATGNSGGTDDFEALIRQYWDSWGQIASKGAATASGQLPWQAGLDSWKQLLETGTPRGVEEAVQKFSGQAGDWLGTMQQVAARFVGRDTTSADVASAWREAVSGQGDGMLRWMLDAARGGNALNDQPWIREFLRVAQGGIGGGDPWLEIPTFGPAREHQARWQALVKMQQHYQTKADAYVEQIRAVLDEAFRLFEVRLGAHETPGSQLTSARAMFDLWIEVAEEAYSKAALSEEFRKIYAELTNAQMRLRAATQVELEKACEAMGVPTRSEMDAAHRKIAELERLVRRMSEVPPEASRRASSRPAKATAKKAKAPSSADKSSSTPARKRAPAPRKT